jgi:hypothetical protein
MKPNHLLPVLFIFILLLSRCAREEADTSPAEEAAGNTGSFISIHPASWRKHMPTPGSITAGEWSDLAHWPLWTQMGKKGEMVTVEKKWKQSLHNRYTVLVTDSLGNSIPDASVSLETLQGNLLDESKTDNAGRCELFPSTVLKPGNLQLKIVYAGQVFYTGSPGVQDGITEKRLNIRRKVASTQDIMFVVDASTSMSDELYYLQSRLKDIINQVNNKSAADLRIRLGSVFYRGYTDDYITRSFPFTENIGHALSRIREQEATGGDNSPEAIDVALEEAIKRQHWSKEAVSRIIFLLLDTPPRFNPAVISHLTGFAQEAARKGIKIIPVTAGDINKETEFLLRCLAIRTNATYVFTNNHDTSTGILPQEADSAAYKGEHLDDLLTRLILAYNEVK